MAIKQSDHRRSTPACTGAHYRQQANACRAIAHLRSSPLHRQTFLRLAWHWRLVAQAVDELVVMSPGPAVHPR